MLTETHIQPIIQSSIDTVPLALGRWYDFAELWGYLENVG
jgi:hypothetical protein